MKTLIIVLAIALLALPALLVAQTAAKKPAAKPATSTPTKVTGAPTKTASGLEYWDIKVGTGATAQTGQHVKKSITPDGSPRARNSIARSAPANRSSSCWAPTRSSKDGTKV
jgi:hypothetical protein